MAQTIKQLFGNGHRTYPLKNEVRKLRKRRGDDQAEQGLAQYRNHRSYSKASGTWGKTNAKNY